MSMYGTTSWLRTQAAPAVVAQAGRIRRQRRIDDLIQPILEEAIFDHRSIRPVTVTKRFTDWRGGVSALASG